MLPTWRHGLLNRHRRRHYTHHGLRVCSADLFNEVATLNATKPTSVRYMTARKLNYALP